LDNPLRQLLRWLQPEFRTEEELCKKRVLLLSDDPHMTSRLDRILSETGYQVRVTNEVDNALDLLEQYGLPDVMVGDFLRPQVDATKFIEKARIRYGKSSLPPILFLYDSEEDEAVASQLDVNDILAKPFEMTTFLEHVHNLIQQ
jgi:DNA-binding response OmpR family regulator